MIIARQSTARTVIVGPILDASGAAVTDGVVGDLKISKNGAAPAALNASATLTHRHTGHYSLALTASDLDTVGGAQVTIDDTVNGMQPKDITVIEEVIFDAMFAASANAFTGAAGSTTLTALAAGSITAAVIATGAIDADAIADNAIDAGAIAADAITAAKIADGAIDAATFAAGAITAAAIATGAVDADAIAADAVTEIQSGLATAANLTTVDTVVDAIKAVTDLLPDAGALTQIGLDAATAATEATGANVSASAAQTAAESVQDTLADLTEDDGGTPRFTANTLEEAPTGGSAPTASAIADEVQTRTIAAVTTVNGLAANTVTASALAADAVTEIQSGLSTLNAAGVRTAVGLASANLDTQLDALPTAAEVWAAGTRTLTAGTNIVLAKGAGITGLNDLSAAQVKAEVDTAISDYDPPTRAELTSDVSTVLTAVGDVPTNAELTSALSAISSAIAALNNLSAAQVNAEVDTAIIDAALATAAALGTAQTAITAIKAKTDSLTFTQAGHVDANVQRVNDVALLGTGVSGDTWRPA